MVKSKSNKQNNNVNNFHNAPEVEKVIDIETKTEQKVINPEEFPDISATVNKEEIQSSVPDEKKEVKVNIINVADKSAEVKADKEPVKVAIVDLSKKKGEKSKSKKKYYSIIKNPFNSKIDLLKIDFDEKKLEKALDSLIYLGGGVIAVTSLTSKAIANIGNHLIKK